MAILLNVAQSQTFDASFHKNEVVIDSLAEIFLQPGAQDSLKLVALHQLDSVLGDLLEDDQSFSYPFDSTKRISILTSSDKLVRFYTYNCRFSNGSFRQAGYVQYQHGKNIMVRHLSSQSGEESSLSNNQENTWRAALYYQLIDIKYKNNTTYTLLGWNGHDELSTKKVIDVFHISQDGTSRFGKPIFEYPKSVKKEFIEFEYSAEVQMTLVYEKDEQTIVFDHLSPQRPSMQGIFAYYGPDMSYDAFVWEKGKWIYKADYDARLDRNLKDRFYEMKLREQQPIFQKH